MFIQRSQCKNTPGICLKKSFISNTDICNGIGCDVNERKMGEFGDYLYTICTLTSVLNVIVMFKVIVYIIVVYFFLSVTIGCTGNIRKQKYKFISLTTNTYLLAMFLF